MVIKDSGLRKDKHVVWECKCDCGNTKLISSQNLLHNNVKSCGCLQKENGKNLEEYNSKRNHLTTEYPKIHNTWRGMKSRCRNKNNKFYNYYGGRGIVICDEWMSFETFLNWALSNGYKDGLQIDRIDNDGNYEPDNCRFVTPKENGMNKRNTRYLTVNGETRCQDLFIHRVQDMGV